MSRHVLFLAIISFYVFMIWTPVFGQDPVKSVELAQGIGSLRAPDAQTVFKQASIWFGQSGRTTEGMRHKFEALWNDKNRPLLDLLADTFELGDAKAAKLLEEARDPSAPAPATVPALLKDERQSTFYRANLALAYAKALSNRRIYEEALDTLRLVKPENVVDPAGYFFTRAVAEHALLLKTEAFRSIVGVVEDVADAPDRYKILSLLMLYDMQSWKDKDLGWIARKMNNIERRLELARGGPYTQKMQIDVVRRLDEIIKELENQRKGIGNDGGQIPEGGANPRQPMPESYPATNPGPGSITSKRLRDYAQQWGKLPEKERTKAITELTRDMPGRYREVIENYFKKLAQSQPSQP